MAGMGDAGGDEERSNVLGMGRSASASRNERSRAACFCARWLNAACTSSLSLVERCARVEAIIPLRISSVTSIGTSGGFLL